MLASGMLISEASYFMIKKPSLFIILVALSCISIGGLLFIHTSKLPVQSLNTAEVSRIGEIGGMVEGDLFADDGVRIHYWFYNRGTETTTIFLHGGPGHGTGDFREIQANDYADTFGSLLVFDQRGGGFSETNPIIADSLTIDRFIKDINELRDFLIPGKPVIIFGRSFGGVLATFYGASHPENVKAFVLVAPGPFDFPDSPQQRQALLDDVGQEKLTWASKNDSILIKKRVPAPTEDMPQETGPESEEEAALMAPILDVGSTFQNNEPLFYTTTHYDLLPEIGDIPMLVVFGKYDQIVPPASIEAMKPFVRNGTFETLEGNHLAAYAYQKEFFDYLNFFFGANSVLQK